MSRFVDRTTIHVAAGDGGNGCASVRREKFKPLAGADGGNGGRGGDVRLVVDPGVHTLLDFHYRPNAEASSGTAGKGNNRHGAAGDDLVLPVPEGTVVLTTDGEVITDLVGDGTSFTAGVGGGGGLGNAALVSRARKHPGFALLGEPGERKDLVLEVKSVADIGLLGFPSAGKSSLISALSAAKPKIADYPFTTLAPNLGVVTADEKVFTVADVPGLLPGASDGRGLGLDFLRHIERCAVLAHVVDCATLEPGRDPLTDVDTLEQELQRYTPSLGAETGVPDIAQRPRVVVLNKIDVPEARELADLVRPELEQRGWRVFEISTATHEGLLQLTFELAGEVERFRAQLPASEPPRVTVRPKPVADNDFTVQRDDTDPEAFVVRGNKPERWVRQTNFGNDEAVSFLSDRLARLGVEEELARQGAQSGSQVTIGDMTFDWEPSTPVGMAALDRDERVSADARKYAKEQRRTSLDASGAYIGDDDFIGDDSDELDEDFEDSAEDDLGSQSDADRDGEETGR